MLHYFWKPDADYIQDNIAARRVEICELDTCVVASSDGFYINWTCAMHNAMPCNALCTMCSGLVDEFNYLDSSKILSENLGCFDYNMWGIAGTFKIILDGELVRK